MLRLLSLSLLFFVGIPLAAGQPFISWQSVYGGTGNDFGFNFQQTTDSGFIVTGVTYSSNDEVTGYNNNGDIWVLKLNATCGVNWAKCYGGSGYDEGDCIKATNDGGYILAGYTGSADGNITSSFGGDDGWLAKLDDTGGVTWQHNYGGSGTDMLVSAQQTNDGGYIAAGSTMSAGGQVRGYHGGVGYDFWVIKVDDTGGLVWSKTYGGTSDDEGWDIELTSDGGYIVAGYTASTDGDVTGFHGGPADYWIMKLDDTGRVAWKFAYGGTGDDETESISQTSDGGYIVTGNSNSTDGDVTGNHGGYDVWTLKLNAAGGVVWKKCYGGSGDDNGQCVTQTHDSGFIVTGSTFSPNGQVTGYHRNGDVWVVKTDYSGNLQWQKDAGGDSLDIGFAVCQTFDSGFAVLGFTYSSNGDVMFNHSDSGTADFWLVKILVDPHLGTPDLYSAKTPIIYPVPAEYELHIDLPEGYENAQVRLLDVLGRSVGIAPGQGLRRDIDVRAVVTGTYVLQIINDGAVSSYEVVRN